MGFVYDILGMFLPLIYYGVIIGVIIFAVNQSNKKKADQTVSQATPHIEPPKQTDVNGVVSTLEDYAELPEFAADRTHFLSVVKALKKQYIVQPPGVAQPHKQMVKESVHVSVPQVASQLPAKQTNPFEVLQNINILLYIGAFLVVGSTALLVGTNSEAFSGFAKFLLVVLFATAFYGSGMYFYTKTPKLKAAGTTFTAIGMLMLPFIAISYHNFIDSSVDTASLWFITSIIGIALYGATYYFMRSVLLEYLVLLMGISSVGSGILSINLPIYWMAWAGVVTATAYLLFAEFVHKVATTKSTLVMAHIITPIGLLIGLSELSDDLWSVAVTLLLAGAFYVLSSFLKTIYAPSRPALLAIGQILWVCAVVAGGADLIDAGKWMAFGLMVLTAVLIGASVALKDAGLGAHSRVSTGVALAGMLISIIAASTYGSVMFGLTLAAALISFVGYALTKYNELAVSGFIAIIVAPLIYVFAFKNLSGEEAGNLLMLVYLLQAAIMLGVGFIHGLPITIKVGLVTSLQVAIGFGAIASLTQSNQLSLAYLLSIVALEFVSVWRLRNAVPLAAAGLYFYLGVLVLQSLFNISTENILWIALITAVVWFGSGLIIKRLKPELVNYTYPLLLVGGTALGISWLASFGFDTWHLSIGSAIITMLSLISVLLYKKSTVLIISVAMFYVACIAIIPHVEFMEYQHAPYMLVFSGVALYGLSFLRIFDQGEKKFLRYGAIAGPAVGSLFENDWPAITSTVATSMLVATQATLERQRFAHYAAAGIGMVALSRLLIKVDIDEVQVYTHLWSAYLAAIAWFESRRGEAGDDGKEILTICALLVLTLPALFQALDSSETWRGLLLISESVGLVLFGILIRYKLVLYWGISVLAIEVLYQLRSVIAVIPKSFFLLLLGLVILGTALFFLVRRKDDD